MRSPAAPKFALHLGLALTFLFHARTSPAQTRTDALTLEQANRLPEAEQAWTTLATAHPKDPEPPAHLGLLASRQEHYAAAIAAYTRALALKPDYPGLHMNLGLTFFKAGRFADATKVFQSEMAKSPGDQRLTILLGMAHFGMADYLVAIPYLKQAAAHDPTSLPLRLTLAHSCLWSKQYACVLATYKEILALNADSAEAAMLAGEALDETGDSTGAIEQFRAAVHANPREPDVHFGLGYLLWKESKYADAAPEFAAELTNDPTHTQARAYLGDTLVELNDFARAAPLLEQAAAAAPDLAMIHRDLGAVYASQGHPDEAIRELHRAIELDATDAAPHYRLARVLQAAGRKPEAAAEFALASRMKQEANTALTDKISGPTPHP